MGLCRRLLRAAPDCVHPVVPVGVRQRCEHAAGKNCEESSKNAKASCAGVVVERSPIMLPIPGTSSVEHLEENVQAASLRLTKEEYEKLSGVPELVGSR